MSGEGGRGGGLAVGRGVGVWVGKWVWGGSGWKNDRCLEGDRRELLTDVGRVEVDS